MKLIIAIINKNIYSIEYNRFVSQFRVSFT